MEMMHACKYHFLYICIFIIIIVVSYVYNVWFGKERRTLSFSVVQRIRIVIAIVPKCRTAPIICSGVVNIICSSCVVATIYILFIVRSTSSCIFLFIIYFCIAVYNITLFITIVVLYHYYYMIIVTIIIIVMAKIISNIIIIVCCVTFLLQ